MKEKTAISAIARSYLGPDVVKVSWSWERLGMMEPVDMVIQGRVGLSGQERSVVRFSNCCEFN